VTSTKNGSANTISLVPVAASASGTVAKITVNLNAGFAGHAKCALYALDGGGATPGTLLATSAELTNPSAGNNDFTFSSPPGVTAGTSYGLAILTDAAFATKAQSPGSVTTYTLAQSYASGFPASVTGQMTSSTSTAWDLLASLTVTNASLVGEQSNDGDTTYVYAGTVGHEDLYDLADLTTTPTTILAVQSRMSAKKSDTGARNGQIRLKSGATEVGGSDTALSTSYGWLTRVDTVDPNTGVPWTAAAINALQVGPKVTA
jgi:hypothetical protein